MTAQHSQNLLDVRKSVDKQSFVFILEERVTVLQENLEDINLTENKTNAIRGGILEIRSLLDLIK